MIGPSADPPQVLAVRSSPCGQSIDQLGWQPVEGFLVAGMVVGVRCGTPAAAAVVRQLLAEHAYDPAPEAATFSVDLRLDVNAVRGVRALSTLYSPHAALCRSRSPVLVLRALVAHVESLADSGVQHLRIAGAALVHRDGRSVLLPPTWRQAVAVRGRLLRQAGYRPVLHPFVSVDAGAATVVVADGPISRRLDRLHLAASWVVEDDRDIEVTAPPGHHRLTVWCVPDLAGGTEVGHPAPVSPAAAVARALPLVMPGRPHDDVTAWGGSDGRRRLEQLSQLARKVPARSVPAPDERPQEMLDLIAAVIPGT